MKKQITVCDLCGKTEHETQHIIPFNILIDRVPSGAGDMDNCYEQYDICTGCIKRIVNKYFDRMNFQDIQTFLNNIMKEFKLKK